MAAQADSYWMGIKPGSECPVEVLHIAGLDFPLVTEQVVKVPGDKTTHRTRIHGVVRQLFPDQVERIKKRIKLKVFRGRRLLSIEHPHYRPQAGDVPIEGFVYLKKVSAQELEARGPISPVAPDHVLSEALAQEDPRDEATRTLNQAAKRAGLNVESGPTPGIVTKTVDASPVQLKK